MAARLIAGLYALNNDFGPLFTGCVAVLVLLVVLAGLTQVAWLIALAAILAIVMSVLVIRAGMRPHT